MTRFLAAVLSLLALLSTQPAHCATSFDLDYRVRFVPEDGVAEVKITTRPDTGRLIQLDFSMPADRYQDIEGDGKVEVGDDRAVWTPPKDGGTLRYRHLIDHRRKDGGFDARITEDLAILRGDDLVPPARTRVTRGADARARLYFELPDGWGVDTGWSKTRDRSAYVVVNPQVRFDRPTGWIIAGDIGVRRDQLESIHLSVAAPRGQAYPRLEILGYINATLDDWRYLAGELPSKLLIAGGGDPMWRGGLSGPRSMWLHADRPMISENGTSTILHELFHVFTGIQGARGEDWIAEGLAEYYAIELLNRAGLSSDDRRAKSLDWMRDHGSEVTTLRARHSSGPRTARAVVLFAELDAEIREASDGKHSLDDVVRQFGRDGRVSSAELQDAVEALIGHSAKALASPLIG